MLHEINENNDGTLCRERGEGGERGELPTLCTHEPGTASHITTAYPVYHSAKNPGRYVCTYVCMHICILLYTYTYEHTYIHIYIYTYIHTYIYIYTYMCIYIYRCVQIYVIFVNAGLFGAASLGKVCADLFLCFGTRLFWPLVPAKLCAEFCTDIFE